MRARKRKCNLPSKISIHQKINNELKLSKINHANAMVKNMGDTHLYLREFAHLQVTIHCGPNRQDNLMHSPLVTTIHTKYHVYKVLKVFGEPSISSVLKILKQLHDRMVIDPKNAGKMTKCQKKEKLQYLMFLKQKRCVKIKGEGCTDVRTQRKYLAKDDTSAPKLATEALFLTCIIDAMEHR